MNHFTEEEKSFVLNWLNLNCYGRLRARIREKILRFMPPYLPDRKWRYIVSDLVSEGLIYSSASWGYFAMPPDPSDLDIEAAKEATIERIAKKVSSLEKDRRNLKALQGLRQGQGVML